MNFCQFVLKKAGWSIKVDVDIPDKCVICVAPHTSNWDFILGKFVYWALNKQASFLVKKQWTVFPFSMLSNPMGGIPVDRNKNGSVTKQVVDQFNIRKVFQVAITPEGTRKPNAHWRKGFYFIARDAKVPILLVCMDYENKQVIFGKIVIPSGDMAADMLEIKSFYKGVKGRNPENFLLPE
jgi:1-acyl-sn-glycerol-3-phosphate acyltransferase